MKYKILIVISKLLSRLIPRSKNICIYGGDRGLRFADNSRYMFIYASRYTDKKCVWLSSDANIVKKIREMGYIAFLAKEPLGIYYGFRAKWHIFDVSQSDTSLYSSIGAYWLNIWHGIPIKNISNIINPAVNKNKKYFFNFANEEFQDAIINSFGIDENNIIITNQPRNIVFYINSNEKEIYETREEKNIINKLKVIKKQKGKILGYFPTWRDQGSENFMGIEDNEELKELNKVLIENNAYILTKRHTCSFKEYRHNGYSEKSENNEDTIDSMSNFITMDFNIDLNSVILECDMLISDYSSVIIDYLLINKPIVLYVYDIEMYKKDPGLYYDYNEFRFGHQVFNMHELIQTLKKYFKNEILFSDEFSGDRYVLKKRFFDKEECSAPILEILDRID
jgi:CDP-glycerol glycerophosphotransferase (TagB/SpsB family)